MKHTYKHSVARELGDRELEFEGTIVSRTGRVSGYPGHDDIEWSVWFVDRPGDPVEFEVACQLLALAERRSADTIESEIVEEIHIECAGQAAQAEHQYREDNGYRW